MLLVLLQVEVRPVGDPLHLGEPAEGEVVLDVHRPLGVVGELLLRVLADVQLLLGDAEAQPPVEPLLDPAIVPLLVAAGEDEVLDLHLLELAVAEDKVAGGDLIAERLADLGDAERQLAAGGGEHVVEVDEDALGGLRAQIGDGGIVLHRPHVSLEHQVEHARVGQLAPALRAGDAADVHGVAVDALRFVLALRQLVGAEAVLAGLAVHHRVGEGVDVAAGLPDAGVHNDRGVQAHHVVPLLDDGAPPGLLDVVLQLHAKGPVVPEAADAAVDLAALKDESPALAQGDEGVHGRCVSHIVHPNRRLIATLAPTVAGCAGKVKAIPLDKDTTVD